jgi:tetratricopeptide (TPR) repeat protein
VARKAKLSTKFSSHPPLCPFCERPLEPPEPRGPTRFGDFDYGSCKCGAVYVHDVTGHNLGAALVEAYGFACEDDWDLAWSLMPDEDYQDAVLENYERETNLIHKSGRNYDGKRIRGALIFIRLSDDIREAGKRKKTPNRKKEDKAKKAPPPKSHPPSKRSSKALVQKMVDAADIFTLKEMAIHDPLVINKIQRLLYSADTSLRWKAVLALGGVAGGIASKRPSQLGKLVKSLVYASNDSAASSWGAIETLGEIIRCQPKTYGSFVRHVLGFLKDPTQAPGVLWAVGRIGELYPELVRSSSFFPIFDLLDHENADIRGHALWAIGKIAPKEARGKIKKMQDDPMKFTVFDGQNTRETTVGQLAKEITMEFEEKEVGLKKGASDDAQKIYHEALILSQKGMSLDAMKKFEEALCIYEEQGKKAEVANICERLADIHVQRGNFKAAISPYQRALAICEKHADDISSVILLEKIIDIFRAMKEDEKALPYYFEALKHVEKLQDAGRSAHYLTGIGDIYQSKGETSDALEAYRLAHKIYKGMGSKERAEILEKGINTLEKTINEA